MNKLFLFWRILTTLLFICLFQSCILSADEPSPLAFTEEKPGVFVFDTGSLKGSLIGTEKTQGINSLIDTNTNIEIAKSPGLFSFYRLLSVNQRWADDFRYRQKTSQVLSDGSVQTVWEHVPDYPVDLTANFRWINKNTLDLGITFSPKIMMRNVEVFLSNYINNDFKGYVYADKTFMLPGKAAFLPADVGGVNDFLYGTYLAFPRDQRSAQIVYDGRWEKGLHPVHFSVTRFYKHPMFLKKDQASKLCVLIMAKRDDCFSLEMSYNREPEDNISNHSSVYFSLFGEDMEADAVWKTVVRLVVDVDIDEEKALELYREFLQ
jgi:hypothetical protein